MIVAEASSTFDLSLLPTSLLDPLWLLASIPIWPLVGAILVGAILAIGKGRKVAHLVVVASILVSAGLSIWLFATMTDAQRSLEGEHGHGHVEQVAGIHEGGGGPGAAEADHAEDSHDGHGDAVAHAGVDESTQPERYHADEHYTVDRFAFKVPIYDWISLGNGQFIALNFLIDPLTAVMLIVVTVISSMVVIYSVGYMRDHHGHPERGYERFFAFIGLFVFSMSMLVMAGNFVLLYLGWELVGLCSYLLIGFYYKKPEAAAAAKKAFIVNRIGDFGFALGIFSLYMFLNPLVGAGENPLDYDVVFRYVAAGALSENQLTLVALLLMCGALGKSAQVPLYVWLPDAMEGPSPVSALIHAATMVTAGIYMIARCGPIFMGSPLALDVILVLGVIGAFFAATMAMAQYDMKRILAYSTISQLAYMFVGLGCAAPDSAVFHLYTHAFFKALLFLCAGSVMHAMGNIIDVRYFSGLRRVLPKTYWLMLIGCLALAGFPLLAGFWSKDEIVHAAFERNAVVGVIMLVTAAMTAYYTFRMFFLCFHGDLRTPPEAGDHPHESPPVMINPLVVLALGAVFAGYAGVMLGGSVSDSFLGFLKPRGFFHHFLASSTIVKGEMHGGGVLMMYISAAIAIAGIVVAYMRYGTAPKEDPDQAALGKLWNLWHAKYYVDEAFDAVFVRPLRQLGRICFGFDRNGIDGAVWFASALPRTMGLVARLGQRGALQGYALGMVIGIVVLLLVWKWVQPAAVAG